MTNIDLALYASSICNNCRDEGRPADESSQDQGDVFVHRRGPREAVKCRADQIWGLIRRLDFLAEKATARS